MSEASKLNVESVVQELEEELSAPSAALVQEIGDLEGDILILGAGGKVGPNVAVMAARAVAEAGAAKRVYAVSRFSNPSVRALLEQHGVTVISADLTEDEALDALPDVPNVIFMAGNKFGTTGNEHFTWMMNSYLPGRVAQRYRNSRIVAFSTLLVYPMADVTHGGSREEDSPAGFGEYAASCVGRERVFEHFSLKHETPLLLFRLGYSIETRYGVLQEIAQSVYTGEPVDLSMGHASVIWQRDVAEYAIRSLALATSPPRRLNITGPEILSIRWLAERFGEKFGKEPKFTGVEAEKAYVLDGSRLQAEFGFPAMSVPEMIDRVSEWTAASGPTIGKPTKFQQRDGHF